MNTFLKKNDQKKIGLFNFLLEQDGYVGIEDLADRFSVNAKSIRLYAQEFHQMFSEYAGAIQLKCEVKDRLKLIKDENFPVYKIYFYFYKRSYNFQLIDYMFNYPHDNINDFANYMIASKSTVFRYAMLLKDYFELFQLSFRPYALKLDGQESNIRCYFFHFYWNASHHGTYPFGTFDKRYSEMVRSFSSYFHLSLNQLQSAMLSYWLMIILKRRQHYKIAIDEELRMIYRKDKLQPMYDHWIASVVGIQQEAEQVFLYEVLHSFGIIDGRTTAGKVWSMANITVQGRAYQAIKWFNEKLKEVYHFSLDLSDDELWSNFLAFHTKANLFYGTDQIFNFQSHEHASKVSKNKKAQAFFQAVLDCPNPEIRKLLHKDKQLLQTYGYVLDYYGLLDEAEKTIKLVLLTNWEPPKKAWFKKKTQEYLNKTCEIEFLETSQINQADLIISDSQVENEKPIFIVDCFPTLRNWMELENRVKEVID